MVIAEYSALLRLTYLQITNVHMKMNMLLDRQYMNTSLELVYKKSANLQKTTKMVLYNVIFEKRQCRRFEDKLFCDDGLE